MPRIGKPRITIVFTGGTISMGFDPAAGGAVPILSPEEILARVPGLAEVAQVEAIDFARLPGPHVTPRRMFELGILVREQTARDDVDGVVVTHGTDTLEETAYLLDLMLSTHKPVVFVGAMRNSSELGWDGPANLRSAVRVAADPKAGGLGVLVSLNDEVLAAAEATKTHTEAIGTFKSRDFGPLGFVDKDQVIITHSRPRRETVPVQRLEERVEIVKLSAGSDGRLIRLAVQDGVKGLVLEGTGRGNVPLTALPETLRAIRAGIPVVITTRCPHGRVLDTYAYEGAGKQLVQAGGILGGMLPSHKARLKLMLLLGAGVSRASLHTSFGDVRLTTPG
jgi:L-asparaginase